MRIQAASTLFVCLYAASLQAQFAPLNITTPSPLPGATAGTNYSVTIQATGGQPGYVFTISAGSLPPGLALASSGLLSGNPTQAGTFQFTVRVVDCNGVPGPNCIPGSATRIYTLAVAPGLAITNSFVEEGAVCQPYSQGMSASGGAQPYQWSASNLPPGLSISAGTGLVSGTPSQQGQFTADIRVTDAAQRSVTRAYLFVIRQQALRVVTTSLPAGAVGVSYVGNLTASGGSRLNWTVAGGDMPPGLLLSTASTGVGVISGIPTTAGTFTAIYRVTDVAGCVASASLPIAISGPSLRITTTTLNPARVGTAYSQPFTATGGSAPLTWSVTAGTLPQGLTLSSAGVLSGTPTVAGSFSFSLTVRDAQQQVDSRGYVLNVSPNTLEITTQSLPSGAPEVPYSQPLSAAGGSPPYTWNVSAGALPQGLTLSGAGVISGTPVQAGASTFTVTVRDLQQQTASRALSISITASAIQITTPALQGGSTGTLYSQALSATGGTAPYTWSVLSGLLPPGLALNAATGVIAGTPTQPGGFTFTVRVNDAQNQTATRQFTINVSGGLTILNTSVPQGRVGVPYEVALLTSGATGNVTWSVSSLPPGLSLAPATGILSGTPSVNGDFVFTVTAVDQIQTRAERTFQLTVLSGIQITTESLQPGVVGRSYQQALSATGGSTPYRWIQLTALPPGLSFSVEGVISGTPTQAGTFQVGFSVSDAASGNASRNYVLTITAPFSITTQSLISGTVNANYNQTLSTTGGRAPVTYQLLSGSLPPGVLLAPATGAITGTPSRAGEFTFTIRAIDADQQTVERTFTITIQGQFRITTDALPDGEVGAGYNATVASTGGSAPVTWSVPEGALPGGLSINASTGVISGTPNAAGRFSFTVQGADAAGQAARQRFTVTIIGRLTLETDAIAPAVLAAPYSQALQATGGETPYRWSASGELPPGLSLDTASGVLSGTPSRVGTFAFTVQVQDRANRSASRNFTLTVSSTLTITITSLPNATAGIEYRATLLASGVSGTPVWSVSGALPEGLTLNATTGLISGTPRASGSFAITVTVRDGAGASASQQLTLTVNALSIPPVVITPDNVELTAQPPVSITLGSAAPVPLTGTVTLTFTAETGGDNPQVRFSNGSRTANFTVAAGQTQASFGGSGLSLQVSNVAGAITLTTRLSTASGLDVTPSPAPSRTVRVPRSAPVLTAVTARRAGNTLTVEVVGYSSTREVATADIQFTTAPGSNVQGTSVSVPVTTAFTAWFQDERSPQFGSAFTLTLPFTVTGDTSSITGVSVTLVNGAGRSASRTAPF